MGKLIWDGDRMVHRFMPHYDDRFRFPSSRDWEDFIVCEARSCVCNTGHGLCFVPSRCEIGEDGRCKNFSPKKPKKKAPNIKGL